MQKNMNVIDRAVRVMVGLATIGIGWFYQSWWGLLGVAMLLTAFIGFCPVYHTFRKSTNK